MGNSTAHVVVVVNHLTTCLELFSLNRDSLSFLWKKQMTITAL